MPGIELNDTSIVKLRPCRFQREAADRFGIIRRTGLSRTVVRTVGLAACECFREGCTIADAKRRLAERFGVAGNAVDLTPLLRSLQNADLIASVNHECLPEAAPPSLYSAYRYYLRFYLTPWILRVAHRKLPACIGKPLAYWVQKLDLAAALWPRALDAEKHFLDCPSRFRPTCRPRQFAKRYFHHLLQNIVDFQSFETTTPAQAERWFSKHIEYDGLEHLTKAGSEGTPLIVAGFHFANTKLLSLLLMRCGYNTAQVWQPNGTFDMSVLTRWHAEYKKLRPNLGGFKNIPDLSLPSYRLMLDSLRSGYLLLWFPDVFPRQDKSHANAAGVFGVKEFRTDLEQSKLAITLCGQRVYLNSWVGAFARMTRAGVVPTALIRRGSRIRMIVRPVLRLPLRPGSKDIEQLNRALFKDLDSLLRLYPEQWFGWHSLYPIQEAEPEQRLDFGGHGHEPSEAASSAREEVKSK
jgi:lauroyl/myristoyl acyltransferase